MRGALDRFLAMTAGATAEPIVVGPGDGTITVSAGGAAHVIGFVGHNGLMDLPAPAPVTRADGAPHRSSLVLACASRPFFLESLRSAGAHPLLLTTGLMAPEAYTLNAAIRSWIGGGSVGDVTEAAARAYQRYQRCSLRAARALFWGASP